ncbi:MAG: hypothetical protein KJZ78_26835 [Bryobacteraceae bacterium]|nr:hypothetical protein [Bryobacteraceae bacterium]
MFDTGALHGIVRQNGVSLGLLPVEHTVTGIPIASEPGLLTFYRIFTTNRRYGESARARPSNARVLPDGALHVLWPASDEHPYTMTAIYRWRDEETLDLETTVEAKAELPDFEIFLSSYLGARFPVTSVYVKHLEGGGSAGFMTAETAYGTWQVYPRDEKALSLVKDGRWTIPPNPVDWAIMPELAAPLVHRREPETGLVVALMAPAEDCFAAFTPERDEPHRSMYLSLFGKTLQAGETARARVRLVVSDVLDDAGIVARYEEYVKETEQTGQR